jgi:hypothetical protein
MSEWFPRIVGANEGVAERVKFVGCDVGKDVSTYDQL